MRLALAESPETVSAREVTQSTWFAGVRQSLGVLTRPQWALAAAALLVLGISLPLILSTSRDQQVSPATAERSVEATPESARTQSAPANLASAKTPPEAAEPLLGQETARRGKALDKSEAKPQQLIAKNPQSAIGDAAGTAGKLVASADLSKKQEAGAVAQEESRTKSENQLAQQSQVPSAAPAAQGARSEQQQTRQQQPTDKDSAQQVAEPKTRADKESNEKSKVADASQAAPPPSPDASRDRAMKRPPSKLALRDSTGEAVRVEERKLGGKHFFLRGGAWTDKDYDPDKDLPTVTVVRDSNVYKDLLNKRNGLKPIMALFTASERAIIVFKGTVYRLIPQ